MLKLPFRLLPILCVSVLGDVCHPTFAQSSPQPLSISPQLEEKVKGEIIEVFKSQQAAWNSHDMDKWAESLHADCDWIHWRGGVWRGKAAVKAGHEAIHQSYYKSSKVTLNRLESFTFIAPEIVLVHARSEMSGDERSPGEVFQYRKTVLFMKENGSWKIRALHNTRMVGVD